MHLVGEHEMRQKLVGGVDLVLAVVDHLGDVAHGAQNGLGLVELDAFLPVIAVSHRLAGLDAATVGQDGTCY